MVKLVYFTGPVSILETWAVLLFGEGVIMFICYLETLWRSEKTAPNWIIWRFKKLKIYLLARDACGAICASHLFGVLLLFSRVNTEQVRANFITWHTKFKSDEMYWTYKQNMCVFCLLFCILWSKIHNFTSFCCINSSPQGAVENVCAWLCYMLFF